MADDPNNPTPSAADLTATALAADQARNAFDSFGTVTDIVKDKLGGFYTQLKNVGVNLNTNQRLTEGQTAAFGALATSVFGARKAFDNLSGIDQTPLNTYIGQWTDLTELIQKSPAFKTASDQISMIGNILTGIGAPIKDTQNAMKMGLNDLLAYGKAFFESADNGQRLQNTVFQLAARTGNLNEVIKSGGPGLTHINELLSMHQEVVNNAAQATQKNAKVIERYYSILGTVPRALEQVVESSQHANKNIDMLSATIQLAEGSGRNYQDVVEDLRTAFRDYNLTGENALKFTARMGELSNNLGIELDEVRGTVKSTADMFKMFGDESEGAANMINRYVKALESTGISGSAALGVVRNMTEGIKNMGTAQKAFLSAQTGGPGGLMGAFQIENMLREGHLDQVMDRVRQTLTRQFGQITSLQEAAQSPQAAANLQRQMMMVQQGPLGQFARDDQSAIRLLEALRNQGKGEQGAVATALSPTVVQDNMRIGVSLQQKSATELTRIRELIQNIQSRAGQANFTTVQQSMAVGAGMPMAGGDVAAGFRRDLINEMEKGATEGGTNALRMAKGEIANKTGAFAVQSARDIGQFINDLPKAISAPIDHAKQLMGISMKNNAETRFREQDTMPTQDNTAISDVLNRQGATAGGVPRREIGTAPPNTVVKATGGGGLGEITVHVEGYCINCGEKMKGDAQRIAVSPQTVE